MCNNWEEYDKELSKRNTRIQMMEIKIKNLEIKLDSSRIKLHDMMNELCTWNLSNQMDLEEKLGERKLGTKSI